MGTVRRPAPEQVGRVVGRLTARGRVRDAANAATIRSVRGTSEGAISRILADHPTAGLSVGATPLYELRRLSAKVGHRIYVLREDLTGFALGGNKVRKLDFLIADALAKDATVLVTTGATALSRNAAAAGRVVGIDVHVVVAGDPAKHNPASREVFERFECTVHHVPDADDVEPARRALVDRLRGGGEVVYELHPGGSDTIGALGYLAVFDDIVRFSARTGVHFDEIVAPTGSTGTQVGLLLGQQISGYETRLIGVAVSQPTEVQRERIRTLAVATATSLGVDFDDTRLIVDDRFLGDGYPLPSEAGDRAVRVFACTEGLLLDRIYTGKAAAGLLHYAASGDLSHGGAVLFVLTGGNAGVYY